MERLFMIIVTLVVLIIGMVLNLAVFDKLCNKHQTLVSRLTLVFTIMVCIFSFQDIRLVILALILYAGIGCILMYVCKYSDKKTNGNHHIHHNCK